MVNNVVGRPSDRLRPVAPLVSLYVLVAFATLVVLTVLDHVRPQLATQDAWLHAVIVAGFAVLLPVRLRAARRGSRGAVVAVSVIATVVAVLNAVEAVVPGLFPAWMRVEMVGIVVLMAAVAVLARRAVRT